MDVVVECSGVVGGIASARCEGGICVASLSRAWFCG